MAHILGDAAGGRMRAYLRVSMPECTRECVQGYGGSDGLWCACASLAVDCESSPEKFAHTQAHGRMEKHGSNSSETK